MKSLRLFLTGLFSDAFGQCGLDRSFGEVVLSQRPDLGQFQCNGAFSAGKIAGQNPRAIAQKVIDVLMNKMNKGLLAEISGADSCIGAGFSEGCGLIHKDLFADLSIAGPGFINITLADGYIASYLNALLQDERLGCDSVTDVKKVILDFGGPNVAKPMHVGHLRSSIIGDCLQRLFRFMGHIVVSDIHMGDWGTQMGMLICELRRRQPSLPYFDASFAGPYPQDSPVTLDDLEEMYPVAYNRCKADKKEMGEALCATVELQQGRPGYLALWRHFKDVSAGQLKRDYQELGITFDLWKGESDYRERIPILIKELREGGYIEESEGALIIPVDPGSAARQVPPLILVKSDGGFLYGTTDLAAIKERVCDLHADQCLYVVDNRQSLHFEQVFYAAHKTRIAGKARFEHIAFGTVNGPDGKPFKTRAGGTMKLKDLIIMARDEVLKRMQENKINERYSECGGIDDIAHMVGIAAIKYADLSNHRLSDYIFDIEKFTNFEGQTGPYIVYAAVRIKSILRKAQERGINPFGPILPPSEKERKLMLELCKLPDAVQSAYLHRSPNILCDFIFGLAQEFARFYQQCHILSEADASLQAAWLSLSRLCLQTFELVLSLIGIDVPEKM